MVSVKKSRKLFIKCNNHLALHSVLETTALILTSYTIAQNHQEECFHFQLFMTVSL